MVSQIYPLTIVYTNRKGEEGKEEKNLVQKDLDVNKDFLH